MNKPSEEQQLVINNLSLGKNVIVDSCAGSGKTTTIGSCALQLPHLRFLLVTYNLDLKNDVIHTFQKYKVMNVETFTFHGLAVKFYSSDCHNDMGIRRIMRNDNKPRQVNQYDVIVLDEAQDMCVLFFKLIRKFITDMGKPVLLLIVGDQKQCIYEFKGADRRFLSLAHKCWADFPLLKNNEFVHCPLFTSYRITNQMRDFINKAMYGEDVIESCKNGVPVLYFKRSTYDIPTTIQKRLQHTMLRYEALYEDFMILIPSNKMKLAKQVENKLVEVGIPCYFPRSDSEFLDSNIIRGKVVFSTFHCSKGRQRKHVFVLGYDETFFDFYSGRGKDKNVCPNDLYVACTRGSNTLHVIQSTHQNMLPFFKMNQNTMKYKSDSFVNFQGVPSSSSANVMINKDIVSRKVDVTAFTKYVNDEVLEIVSPILDSIFIEMNDVEEDNCLDIKAIHETSYGGFEDVSDINGTVLPIIFFDRLREEAELNKNPVLQYMIQQNISNMKENQHTYLKDLAGIMPLECETIAHYLYVGCLHSAVNNETYSRIKQIPYDNYNWLTESMVDDCVERLRETIGSTCTTNWQPEYSIIYGDSDEDHLLIDKLLAPYTNIQYRFSGRIDLLTETDIWELKCTSQLTVEHKLQVVLYSWLYYNRGYGQNDQQKKHRKYFHLFNFKTNEHLRLNATIEQLNSIVFALVKGKENLKKMDDEQFLNSL